MICVIIIQNNIVRRQNMRVIIYYLKRERFLGPKIDSDMTIETSKEICDILCKEIYDPFNFFRFKGVKKIEKEIKEREKKRGYKYVSHSIYFCRKL